MTSPVVASSRMQFEFGAALDTQVVPVISNNITADISQGDILDITLTSNVNSWNLTGWDPNGFMTKVTLFVRNTGNFNINAWPVGTLWSEGLTPTISQGNGKFDVYLLFSATEGNIIYASVVGQNYH